VIEDSSTSYILYGTSACHLCDLAEGLLLAYLGTGEVSVFTKVDISDSEVLFERYGVRIPVLAHADGAELDWPFSASQLTRFLQR
jgi:hypothetical protein